MKEDAFRRFGQPGADSGDFLKAGMGAFWWSHQADLLRPWVGRFVETLPEVLAATDFEYFSRGYARILWPHLLADGHLLESARRMLESEPGQGPALRRILLEEISETERVLRLRAL